MMLLTFIAFVGFLCLMDYILKKPKNDMLKSIPSVRSLPVFGAMFEMSSFNSDSERSYRAFERCGKLMHFIPDLTQKFTEYRQRYGKTYKCWIAHRIFVTTSDLKYVEPILNNNKHIAKHIVYGLLREWLGEGLLLSTGTKWHNRRKIITPTFHFRILEHFVEVFNEQSMILVEKLKDYADGKSIVDIYSLICLTTLDIIAETAMGTQIGAQKDDNSRYVNAVKDVTNILAIRFMNPHLAVRKIFKKLQPKVYNKQLEAILYMHLFTKRIIDNRRKAIRQGKVLDDSDNEDQSLGIKKRMVFLDVLLQSKKLDGTPLSDDEIREEVDTFMFEGHDTTTSAISFALRLIATHPKVQQSIFSEIKDIFGNDTTTPITYRNLQALKYLNCTVKESLRLFPPIPTIGRSLKEDLQTKDCIIPAGTNVIIVLWEILHDPDLFPDPLVFKPERFLEESTYTNVFSYIPFSAGPRNCIGQRFALLEIKCVLAQILRHFELLPLGDEVQPSVKIILKSKNGISLGLRQRVY